MQFESHLGHSIAAGQKLFLFLVLTRLDIWKPSGGMVHHTCGVGNDPGFLEVSDGCRQPVQRHGQSCRGNERVRLAGNLAPTFRHPGADLDRALVDLGATDLDFLFGTMAGSEDTVQVSCMRPLFVAATALPDLLLAFFFLVATEVRAVEKFVCPFVGRDGALDCLLRKQDVRPPAVAALAWFKGIDLLAPVNCRSLLPQHIGIRRRRVGLRLDHVDHAVGADQEVGGLARRHAFGLEVWQVDEGVLVLADFADRFDAGIPLDPLQERALETAGVVRDGQLGIDALGHLNAGRGSDTDRADLGQAAVQHFSGRDGLLLERANECRCEVSSQLIGDLMPQQHPPVLVLQRVNFHVREPVTDVGVDPAQQLRSVHLEQREGCQVAVLLRAAGHLRPLAT